MMNAQKPVSYMLGNGEFVGMFVVESCSVITKVADDQGGIRSADVALQLKEYAGEIEEEENPPAVSNGYLGAIGSISSISSAIDGVLNDVGGIFNDLLGLLDGSLNLLDFADQILSTIPLLRGAQDALEMLRGINGALTGSLNIGDLMVASHQNFTGDNAARFGSFIDSVIALMGTVNEINALSSAAFEANDILPFVDQFEAHNTNLVSQRSDLNIARYGVMCNLGLRDF